MFKRGYTSRRGTHLCQVKGRHYCECSVPSLINSYSCVGSLVSHLKGAITKSFWKPGYCLTTPVGQFLHSGSTNRMSLPRMPVNKIGYVIHQMPVSWSQTCRSNHDSESEINRQSEAQRLVLTAF